MTRFLRAKVDRQHHSTDWALVSSLFLGQISLPHVDLFRNRVKACHNPSDSLFSNALVIALHSGQVKHDYLRVDRGCRHNTLDYECTNLSICSMLAFEKASKRKERRPLSPVKININDLVVCMQMRRNEPNVGRSENRENDWLIVFAHFRS